MLILFDIDATLITTSRSGILAMQDAGRALHDPGFRIDGVEFAGRLDPLIVEDLLRANGVAPSAEIVAGFRRGYGERLAARLSPAVARALPGVVPLLEALRARPRVAVGLLTGNYPETGAMKLRACGLDPEWFTVRVWGDDSPHAPPCRTHLPAVGLARYAQRHGRAIHPSQVTIIGDTPHDVACAKANACRVLGVATGSYSVAELEAAGADSALQDLSDTSRVVEWLMESVREDGWTAERGRPAVAG
jgi:phosphoglycolate phosphatase